MKIVFEQYGTRYTVEDDVDSHDSRELKAIFSKILVQAGFAPSVIESEDDGHYEYVAEDEIVVKREQIENENN